RTQLSSKMPVSESFAGKPSGAVAGQATSSAAAGDVAPGPLQAARAMTAAAAAGMNVFMRLVCAGYVPGVLPRPDAARGQSTVQAVARATQALACGYPRDGAAS